jgi:hypothetical protein
LGSIGRHFDPKTLNHQSMMSAWYFPANRKSPIADPFGNSVSRRHQFAKPGSNFDGCAARGRTRWILAPLLGSLRSLPPRKIRDHCMDNMQAKSGSALIATCREERVEGFAPDA